MCGFAGEMRLDGRQPDVEAVERMASRLGHRGPDGAGYWSSPTLALAHRRLKIIDLSENAAQPMIDPELGLVVVFNGCIYNYRDLRAELETRGYRFFSTGDTEVLLKAYHHWGDDFVTRLNGMFAFCIAETETGRVVLGRDRLGIKPLYLTDTEGGIRFASSLPALLAGGGVDTAVDPVALHHYFVLNAVVPGERTILRGVRRVPAATVTAFDSRGRRHDRVYWQVRYGRDAERSAWKEDDWAEAILESLRASVRRRLVADVPVGVMLSGGLDSSLIVGLIAENGGRPTRTYSIGFGDTMAVRGTLRRIKRRLRGRGPGMTSRGEFDYSDLVARTFGTDHHRIRVPARAVARALPDVVAAMSEPLVSQDISAWYLLSQAVSKEVKVVHTGQGADEVFAGYAWHRGMPGAAGTGAEEYSRGVCGYDQARVAEILNPEYCPSGDVSREFVARHFAAPGADTPLDRVLRFEANVALVEEPLKRVDTMTMRWGVEARVPFLDHELVELAAACPPEMKLSRGGKGILKHAARGLLPPAVVNRRKGYFAGTVLRLARGPLRDSIEAALTDPAARRRGLFRPSCVEQILRDPGAGHVPRGPNTLWQLGILELWLQTHVDSAR